MEVCRFGYKFDRVPIEGAGDVRSRDEAFGKDESQDSSQRTKVPKNRCLPQFFDGIEKNVKYEDLKNHCVKILDEPGLFCCLNQWFTDGSSTFMDPILFDEMDPNKTPEDVAIVYPGLQRFKVQNLEMSIKRTGWKNPVTNDDIAFYIIITSANRTQYISDAGLPSATHNPNSKGTYSFEGTIKVRNGHTLQGQFENLEWVNNQVVFDSQKCTQILDNGWIYTGEWLKGQRHGKGRLTMNEDFYEGEFKNSSFDGQGTYFYEDGTYEKGKWVQGRREGYGITNYSNGHVYEGEIKNNLRDGSGTMTYSNGDIYIGQWKLNKKWGRGAYYDASTDQKMRDEGKSPSFKFTEGVWENGVRVTYTR